MDGFNYQKICSELISSLPLRTQDIISRRFGFKNNKKETLEFIGKNYGITRERVRQIIAAGLKKIEPKTKKYREIFSYFKKELKKTGGFRREDILLENLGGEKKQPYVYFLLNSDSSFKRIKGNEIFYTIWALDEKIVNVLNNSIVSFIKKLKKENKVLPLESFQDVNLPRSVLISCLEAAKEIGTDKKGRYGLIQLPEITPRGVKDKSFLVLKEHKKPLHFTDIAKYIGENALPRTVHNALIKDPRFVLVGRGMYALADWGYMPGHVKDVIYNILKEAGRPLTKEEIIEKVAQQRLVKKNTILLNLNQSNFYRDEKGRYTLKS